MQYTKYADIYESPIGKIFLGCDETGLTEVSFVKENIFKNSIGACEKTSEIQYILADRKNTANAENIKSAEDIKSAESIENIEKNISILTDTKCWLDIYFSGKEPGFVPPFHVSGTPFQLRVWEILQKIPYAKTVAYGEIAKQIAKERGISRMSAQAVGGAVGSNKIGIIIPCHRVVGANGNLTGYAGGIEKKAALLKCEGVDMSGMYIPQ